MGSVFMVPENYFDSDNGSRRLPDSSLALGEPRDFSLFGKREMAMAAGWAKGNLCLECLHFNSNPNTRAVSRPASCNTDGNLKRPSCSSTEDLFIFNLFIFIFKIAALLCLTF
jgi:hypothetical protein